MKMDGSDDPLPARETDRIKAALTAGDPTAWSNAEVARLVIIPALVVLLFAGGVYWIKVQHPAASSVDQGPTSTIQVRLVPQREETPIPIDSTSQATTANVAHSNPEAEQPDDQAKDEVVSKSPDQASLPVEASPSIPSISRRSTVTNVVPNNALVKFQQSLLKHIARFQRYPAAAHNRLQGTVETFFSIDRRGRLLGVWVKTSSGQTLLDTEAIETIKRAQPLPSIPAELPDRLNVQIQLAFDPS
ncbi:TonB family protein [Bradyrhizobium sp. Leo170]|uniref:energy transducer TonB family protein n=1 Tax=Bradyrhizobium sp. Leo170 TaxID=1571199 RepID=UPI00102E588D|nr:TonB family protein [Bradyrhizobium sp. Leo170]TAI63694.1 energy transducer TonB [Bradyrhizobium sp. Leo170]